MAPGARSKFGAPMFELEAFRKQMYCNEEILVTLLGLLTPSQWFCARGIVPPFPPHPYAPDSNICLVFQTSDFTIFIASSTDSGLFAMQCLNCEAHDTCPTTALLYSVQLYDESGLFSKHVPPDYTTGYSCRTMTMSN